MVSWTVYKWINIYDINGFHGNKKLKSHPSWISVNVTSYKQTLFAKTSKIKKRIAKWFYVEPVALYHWASITKMNPCLWRPNRWLRGRGTGAENRTQSMGHNRADWCNSLYVTLCGFCRSVVPAGYLFMDIVQRE